MNGTQIPTSVYWQLVVLAAWEIEVACEGWELELEVVGSNRQVAVLEVNNAKLVVVESVLVGCCYHVRGLVHVLVFRLERSSGWTLMIVLASMNSSFPDASFWSAWSR